MQHIDLLYPPPPTSPPLVWLKANLFVLWSILHRSSQPILSSGASGSIILIHHSKQIPLTSKNDKYNELYNTLATASERKDMIKR